MADSYFTPYLNEQTQLISETTRMGMFLFDVKAAFSRVAAAVGTSVLRTDVASGTHLVAAGEQLLHVTYTDTGTVAITLPSAVPWENRYIRVKDAGGGASNSNITVTPNGTEKIDGASNYVIESDYGAVELYSDGHNWFVL